MDGIPKAQSSTLSKKVMSHLSMSLARMTNFGFQFEFFPVKTYLSCARIGMIKIGREDSHVFFSVPRFDRRNSRVRLCLYWLVSRCARAADCVYTGQSPDMQKSIMCEGGGEEGWWWGCRGVLCEKSQQDEKTVVSGDYWQADGLRRKLIRRHKDKRQYLHEMEGSEPTPIPKGQL